MQKKSSKLLFAYWNSLRGARSAPDRRDLDPTQIRDALAYTFILQAEDDGTYAFRLAGSHLCSAYCRELKARSFSELWQAKDIDAIETLVRAVTDDHAVALVTFQGSTITGQSTKFETILMPLRHNGSTNARILGAMTALQEPYWLGTQPLIEQKITGLRLIWPDDPSVTGVNGNDAIAFPERDAAMAAGPVAVPARVFGFEARRYAHLAVIDGGRS
ncbi:MAG: PAS domain-containing protein [Alphaproteobacteria bacterium]|nr:PAS domain-containing protein [Alphaproteobacteria bacterium]